VRRPRVPCAVVVALALLAPASCTGAPPPGAAPASATPASARPASATPASTVKSAGRPNIVVLLSDDQAMSLFHRRLMPNVFSRLVDQGATFDRAYVNVSQCCPSRASILTGLYAHNTGVDANDVPLDGRRPARPTIALALHDAGYRTMLAGKYLNSESCHPQPGWDQWVCGTKVTHVNPVLDVNGKVVKRRGFTVDALAGYATHFIQENDDPEHPLFLYFAPRTPHLPADDHRADAIPVPAYRPPSFNALPDPGSRPAWARVNPLSPQRQRENRARYTGMARQLPALDRAIGRILDALEDRAEDTLVLFMSDNGFLYGEHRLTDKIVPYEESIRVPLVIRYPALLAPGRFFSTDALVSNVDVAPTVMDAAGVPWGADGTSLLPILRDPAATVRTAALIEWCTARAVDCPTAEAALSHIAVPRFSGVVTEGDVYVRYSTGERELYDLRADPFELQNLAGLPESAEKLEELKATLHGLLAPPDTPATTIAGGPAGTITDRNVTFRFFSEARTTGFLCSFRGPGHYRGPEHCDAGVKTYSALGAGSYVFTVTAVDESGARDPSPAVRRFFVST
jgi:N-acetylglucosamine-6-sulfatase